MGNRVGSDEMFLKFGLDRCFDLVDLAHRALNFCTGADIAQRDACAGACGVAGGCHLLQRRVGNHAQHHRMQGRDMGAERAGQNDAVDLVHAARVHQQPRPGVKRRLRQLDCADITLGHGDARAAIPGGIADQVTVCAPFRNHAFCTCCGGRAHQPVFVQQPRHAQFRHCLDDARSAYSGDPGAAGCRRKVRII